MLDEPLWYWLIFLAAAVLIAGPWLLYRWEERQRRRDKQVWEAMRR